MIRMAEKLFCSRCKEEVNICDRTPLSYFQSHQSHNRRFTEGDKMLCRSFGDGSGEHSHDCSECIYYEGKRANATAVRSPLAPKGGKYPNSRVRSHLPAPEGVPSPSSDSAGLKV